MPSELRAFDLRRPQGFVSAEPGDEAPVVLGNDRNRGSRVRRGDPAAREYSRSLARSSFWGCIQYNSRDTGHQRLLSGDALHLEIKRKESCAYPIANLTCVGSPMEPRASLAASCQRSRWRHLRARSVGSEAITTQELLEAHGCDCADALVDR
jgi:hypothetical protein